MVWSESRTGSACHTAMLGRERGQCWSMNSAGRSYGWMEGAHALYGWRHLVVKAACLVYSRISNTKLVTAQHLHKQPKTSTQFSIPVPSPQWRDYRLHQSIFDGSSDNISTLHTSVPSLAECHQILLPTNTSERTPRSHRSSKWWSNLLPAEQCPPTRQYRIGAMVTLVSQPHTFGRHENDHDDERSSDIYVWPSWLVLLLLAGCVLR